MAMTVLPRELVDKLWNEALRLFVLNGEQYTRYDFAALLRDHVLEEAAKVCDDEATRELENNAWCAQAIRALKGEKDGD